MKTVLEAFAREMILFSGTNSRRFPGEAKMGTEREFTGVNDRLSRACPVRRASALGTFLTQHESKMAFVQRYLLILLSAVAATTIHPALAEDQTQTDLEPGKAIAFDRNAGNCLACHAIDDGELPGNSGPPLIQMQQRFPERDVLRKQVWDATVRNPNTVMPPYGKHMILTEEQIDQVVDYLLTL